MELNQQAEGVDINLEEFNKLTIEQIIDNAEEQVESLNYDKARALYELGISNNPDNDDILCSYGFFLCDIKEHEKARELLMKSIQQNPGSNPKKYLHIGQLYNGNEAVQAYQRAIELLMGQFTQPTENTDLDDIRTDIASAYSALAEIYLTDLVETPNSLVTAKQYLEQALNIDQKCMDAFFQLADLALNNNERDIAKKYLQDIVNYFKTLSTQSTDDDKYTHEFKMSVIRLLIEVENYQDAIFMLTDILEDDELNPEFLYFLAFTHYKLQNYATSSDYLMAVQLDTIKHDTELYTAALELQDELKKQDVTKDQIQDEQSWITDEDDYDDDEEEKQDKPQMDIE